MGLSSRHLAPNRLRALLVSTVALGLLAASGCAAGDSPQASSSPDGNTTAPTSSATSSAAPSSKPPAPAEVGANELGKIPILMYHRITPDPQSVYDRTPEAFRAELQRLAEENYVPITTSDYAAGRIDTPAGTHPVVLTFDDASTSQFRLDSSGEPAANTAVAIMREVAAQHPDFRATASFYITTPPFGGNKVARSLRWLHEHGFELGNHTLNHPTLSAESPSEVKHQIAGMQRRITKATDAEVSTIALPHGVHPTREELARSGESDGIRYEHDAVLLVGARPAPAPFTRRFDPLNVPRIRSQDGKGESAKFGSKVWLDKLAANPAVRYTSDGNPDVISYPSDSSRKPAKRYAERAESYQPRE
ncbi:Polysaccharide deacetylase [Actinopolyspora mzabensis]|uniref:Polysaccharide deacetylase n=1 Tax=Actinopolyspora mzabensis TaxID=995066 RepID=A0A1G8ZL39_ACTMZ|nr:polysaccharide deacetylase family protein [Actinopolyspora mzabensis]SDK15829.1 Polysaccharide deacetylase [Actinopolyspora mzabensis]